MNNYPQDETISALRAQLRHFDESPDFGDGEAVQVIRLHLLDRICEAEVAIKYRVPMKPNRRLLTEAA
ncbi:MAG: hypothetical protein WBQ95_11085 [Terracidiphilus sp.]